MLDANVVSLWQAESDGVVVGVKPEELIFTVRSFTNDFGKEERTVVVGYKGDEYLFSERGSRSLSKLTGISNRLINELPSEQIISDIKFQISKVESMGIIIHENKIISMFNSGKIAYAGYGRLVSPIESNVLFSWGNAIDSDFIMIQMKQFETEEFIGGLNLLLSSTANARNIFSYGILSKTHKIFWRDTFYGKESEKVVEERLVQSYVEMLQKNVEFVVQLNSQLLEKAEKFKIQSREHLDGLMVSLSNRKLRAMVIHAFDDPIQDKDLLDKIGRDKIDNLKDIFLLLTCIANLGPNVKVKLNFGAKIYDWLIKTLAPVIQ